MSPAKVADKVLEYKGKPLRRKDNIIYYGSMADTHIAMIQIVESEKVRELDVPSRVTIQLQRTESGIAPSELVVKKGEKASFYEAVDLAAVWLDRALAGK